MASTQTATTGNLGSIQRTVISQMRYTEEHNMPVVNLIEKFTLRKGEKQIDIPKAGQMTASDLVDGIDMTDSEDIDTTVVTATTAEVGLKVIITDKLARQFNQDVFGVVGRQMGDAMARKKDTDAIALFSALNEGTAFGADNKSLSYANASAVIANAKAKIKVITKAPAGVGEHMDGLLNDTEKALEEIADAESILDIIDKHNL